MTTVLHGASVEEMETSVTKPIEDIINTISGIDELRSTTGEGVSVVTVQFELWKNGDVGAQEVRDKVNTILPQLPEGTETPIVNKFDTDSMPVLTIAVSGRRDFREVTEIARKTDQGAHRDRARRRRRQPGRRPDAGHEHRRSTPTGSPPTACRSTTCGRRCVRQNLEVPGGRVEQGPRELILRTLGRLNTAAEFNDLIVANRERLPGPHQGHRPGRGRRSRSPAPWPGSTARTPSAWSSRSSRARTRSKVVDDDQGAARPRSGPPCRRTSRSRSSRISRGSSSSRSRR